VRLQGQVLPALEIPCSSGGFSPDAKFTKPADENILAICQGRLDGFQDRFKDARGFESGNDELVFDGLSDVFLGEGHGPLLRKEGGFAWREPHPFSSVKDVYHLKVILSRNLGA
jgi:hypothetical protein